VSVAANVVVVGSINEDQVLRVDRLPRRGETVIATDSTTSSGGKGANQAVAAARAGVPTTLVAALGTDARGMRLQAHLRAHGIDLSKLLRVPGPSGAATVLVDAQGDNSIVVHSGANAALTAHHVRDALVDIERGDVVLLQCEVPPAAVEAAVQAATNVRATTILNWSPVLELDRAVVSNVDVLVVNREEAASLLGEDDSNRGPDPAMALRLSRAFGTDVVVTLGADGAACSINGALTPIPSASVPEVVDTTGAGDTFAGTLAAAVAARQSLIEATRAACQAAATSVARLGAQPAPPGRAVTPSLRP
jgi:ribokinase